MKYRAFIYTAVVLLCTFVTGCKTTSTSSMYIPEGGKVWPPKTIIQTADLTVEKTYGYKKEQVEWDGKKHLCYQPTVRATISMPSGSWSLYTYLVNEGVEDAYLDKHPDWWDENITPADDVISWATPGKFLIPGFGIVVGWKNWPAMHGHWDDSDVFYGHIHLEVDHFKGETDPEMRAEYLGILIPDEKNRFITKSAVLIPWGYGYYGKTLDKAQRTAGRIFTSEAIIFDETGLQKLTLLPVFKDWGPAEGFFQFVDDQIHFISYGGTNEANCQGHWLSKSGELVTTENIFFGGTTPDKKFYEYTEQGGVVSVDWDSGKKPLASFTGIPRKKIEIKERAAPVRSEKGDLLGFIVTENETGGNKPRYGWRGSNFDRWTGFVWDDVDPSLTNGLMLVHLPEKGWAAILPYRANQPYLFEGMGDGPQGKLAAMNHGLKELAEEMQLHKEKLAKDAERRRVADEAKRQKEHEEYLIRKAAEEQRQAEINAASSGSASGEAQGYTQSWSDYKDEANQRRKDAQQQQRERDMKNGIFRDKSFYD